MADDFILINGDTVEFKSDFNPATVVVAPGTLVGKGPAKICGQKACVDGDEKKVMVPGCAYTTKTHTIPGAGALFIDKLADDQVATTTNTGGKPVLLVGSEFDAKFTVMVPAQQPSAPSPIPDTTLQYKGKGSFKTENSTVKGT